jgi:hypothetical protein
MKACAEPMTGERELVACLQKSASTFCRRGMVVGSLPAIRDIEP